MDRVKSVMSAWPKRQLIAGFLLLCLIGQGLASAYADLPPVLYPKQWKVTFEDQFDGTTLDTSKWNTTYLRGLRNLEGNGEQQWYTDNAFKLENGILKIMANKRDPSDTSVPTQFKYTSGVIASWNKFSQAYGYYDIRAKVPKGRGLWPAFWLVPNNGAWPPEIDIFEILGHQTTVPYFAYHYKDSVTGKKVNLGGKAVMTDLSADFHNYGLFWAPDRLVWFVDGKEKYRVYSPANVTKLPMYVIANLAVGGYWPGYPDGTTPFPTSLDIDYIRVYQNIYQK